MIHHPTITYDAGPRGESRPTVDHTTDPLTPTTYGAARAALAKAVEPKHPADEPSPGQLMLGLLVLLGGPLAVALVEGLL